MEKFKLFIYGITLVIAVACTHRSTKKSTPPLQVEVAKVQQVSIYNSVEVASEISSLYDVVILPRINGFLRSINFKAGTPVTRGRLLFVIDPDPLTINLLTAQAELESAQAQEILAHNNYLRAVPLADIDAISQSDLDQYTATHSAAVASVTSAREALKNAELSLSYTKIYAPIDGLVANSPAKEGDYVGPSTSFNALTTISYIDTVEVEIPIPTSIYLRSVPSSSASSFDNSKLLSNIELTLSGGNKYSYPGKYNYTLKDSPSASSSVVIVVKFPNPELRLKEGMFARVRANIGEPQQSIIIPQAAVSQTQGINSVWIMQPDSTVELREVTLGGTYDQSWVVEKGLTQGETVLLSGQLKVHNGVKVAPTKR